MELWPGRIWKWECYSCHTWKHVEVQAPALKRESLMPNLRPVPACPVQVPAADPRLALICVLHPSHSLLNLR